MALSKKYDIAILGSGFGASLLAAILSKSGLEVCLIDQGSHPRFTIGESSTPAADMLLQSLCRTYGLAKLLPLCRFGTWRETYPQIRCGCKRGFSYIWHGGGNEYLPTQNHTNELLVAASSNRAIADTQWYRADVDQYFCQFAVNCGAKYFPMTSVQEILKTDDFAWKLRLENNHEQIALSARFLIDGTGPAGLLLKSLQIPEITEELQTNTSAIYSHFENVPLVADWLTAKGTDLTDFPYPIDDSAVHHVFQDGWLWQLRFEDGPTSLGYVLRQPSGSHIIKQSAQEAWRKLLEQKPALNEITSGSTLSANPGQIYQTQRIQRLYQQAAGNDWAALPYTAGFIDPLHSTGIAHTLLGVQRLAAILTQFDQKNCEVDLKQYSTQIIAEIRHVDQLVSICYQNLDDFSRFSAACMLYFAAATNFEKNFHSGQDDFLCAANPAFRKMLHDISNLIPTGQQENILEYEGTETFINQVESGIAPFNHVGLFTPKYPNMYYYTTAEK